MSALSVCGSAHQQHCYGRVPLHLCIQYTYSSISVICRFGSNNLMASWGCEGDGFVGFKRGRDIAGCGVDKGVVKGVAAEIVQRNVAPVLCVYVCNYSWSFSSNRGGCSGDGLRMRPSNKGVV